MILGVGLDIKCCDFIGCDRGRGNQTLRAESRRAPDSLSVMYHFTKIVQFREVFRSLLGVVLWGQPVWSTRHVGVMELFSL